MTAISGNSAAIQQGSVLFNFPVSEDSPYQMGQLLNYLLSITLPVGSIIDAVIDPNTFQAELGSPFPYTWVLADGSSLITSIVNSPNYLVTSSTYSQVTGFTSLPDLRGVMKRGKNNGRSDGNQNPAGDLPLGQMNQDIFALHDHVGLFDQASNAEWGQSGAGAGAGGKTLARLTGFPGPVIFPIQLPETGLSSDFYTSPSGTPYTAGYQFVLSIAASTTQGSLYEDSDGNQYIVAASIIGQLALTTSVPTVTQGAPGDSGTLTLVSGSGDTTITYSSVTAIVGNFPDTAPKNRTVNSFIRIN